MELLRIMAMLMIVVYHIYCHCISGQLTDTNSIQQMGNDWFCHPWFSKRLCILAVIAPMGPVANAIFILISGYFMAEKKSIDLTKVSKKLLLQLGFASIALGLASIYAYHNITEFPIKLIQFNTFNWMSWYVGYYFIVIVIAKVYLNSFLSKLEQKNYVMFMMVLFALIQFSWSTSVISNLGGGLETVCTGIFLYSLGGYVKKYNPFASLRSWAVLAIIIITNLIVLGNFYISTAGNILAYDSGSGNMFIQSIPGYGNNQIVTLVLGIATFELFRRFRVPGSKVINFIGASTFMVYLLHDNEFFYKIWNTQDWVTLLYNNIPQFCCKYLLWALGTFAAGLLCYALFVVAGRALNYCKPLVIKPTE